MFEKKLSQEDLEEFKKRTEMINEHILISQALEMQKHIFLRNILPKYGCDLNKDYNINFKTGRIKEIKKPQPQN